MNEISKSLQLCLAVATVYKKVASRALISEKEGLYLTILTLIYLDNGSDPVTIGVLGSFFDKKHSLFSTLWVKMEGLGLVYKQATSQGRFRYIVPSKKAIAIVKEESRILNEVVNNAESNHVEN